MLTVLVPEQKDLTCEVCGEAVKATATVFKCLRCGQVYMVAEGEPKLEKLDKN